MGRSLTPLRADGLEIDEAGDGFIVFDPLRDRVHYLNHTAALVLELATGDHSAEDIASWIARAYALDRPPTADIERLIDDLTAEGLLQDGQALKASTSSAAAKTENDPGRPYPPA